MIRIDLGPRWRVDATLSLDVPLPATTVWGQMRDYRRFLTIDPLHVDVRGPAGLGHAPPPVGTPLTIEHRLLGVVVHRRSRMLRWCEGEGFAVSDLSRRGPRVGFPHVCDYRIAPLASSMSRLTVSARGRWTATRVPRPLVRLWLWCVLRSTEVRLQRELRGFAAWRRTRAAADPRPPSRRRGSPPRA